MSDSNEYDFEQVIDAFEADAPDEIVHIIQNEVMASDPVESQIKQNSLEKDDLIIMVPPILSTNQEQQRISISIDEIRRRVEVPEKLCATNLLSLLHLSKPRTPDLKETLAQYGLEKISKRSAVVSSFSKLSETEAGQLAEDFFSLSAENLNTKEIGDTIANENGGWENFEEQSSEIKELMQEISKEITTNDSYLNLATHGFSPLIIKSVINLITDVLTQ